MLTKWKIQNAASVHVHVCKAFFTLSTDKKSGRLGCFGWMLVLMSFLFIAATFPLTIFMCVKVVYLLTNIAIVIRIRPLFVSESQN